jgi:hypothetical protein
VPATTLYQLAWQSLVQTIGTNYRAPVRRSLTKPSYFAACAQRPAEITKSAQLFQDEWGTPALGHAVDCRVSGLVVISIPVIFG